ncbi:MAG: 3-hydroxyacyl-CoA dehydrogenase [Gammaproteobacteria bacterium]|jgi:3-hydroxyacyl-CoA dehydrogenase
MVAISAMVSLDTQDDVAVITIDNPPVNALSHGVRVGIKGAMERIAAMDAVHAVVLVCSGRTFIAGADITEFGKPFEAPDLLACLDPIEASQKPVVAAIHGTALGGGLEVALSCHYRVSVGSAKFGLPEVKLGLIPGAGGTQRLPRAIGPEKALDMIVSGTPIGAREALQRGLVDEVVSGDLLDGAIDFARRMRAQGDQPVLVRNRSDKVEAARATPELFENFRKTHARRMRGFEAPQACITTVEAAVNLPFDEGFKVEQEVFGELMGSVQARAQQYFFFSEREAGKIPDVPRDTPQREINRAVVLGSGTMGGGIAMNFANAGIPVTMVEVNGEALERGLATIRGNYENTEKKGRISSEDVEQRMELIDGSLNFDATVATGDIIVEAVFEDMRLKKEIFSRLDRAAKPDAILATNTSALNVDEIASATSRPESVIGMHFFSPANVMRLIEVVRGKKTSNETIATCMGLSKELGKVPVLVGVCHGFVGNRMLAGRSREAQKLILEGALPQQVDKVLFDFGFPMGPFAMSDLAGLDIGWNREKSAGATIRERLCEADRRGQKTNAGYYDYAEGDRTPQPSAEVEAMILEFSAKHQVQRREITDEEILARCIYPMINEGAKLLEEGIAIRASDIDVVWIYGYGWPAYWGGPMFYADTVGLKTVHDALVKYEAQFGPEWKPSALLASLAREGKGFLDV